jgi:hypothetical protein
MKMASKTATHRPISRPDPRHTIAKFPYLIGVANISVAGPDSATAGWVN